MKRKRFAKYIYDNAIVCELCGSSEDINVHHKDGNAENNDDSNASVLCENCHRSIHKWQNKAHDIKLDSDYHRFLRAAYAKLYPHLNEE